MPRPVVIKAKKPAKYRNVKVQVDGHTFDSKREAHHYHILKLRERIGEIKELKLQPRHDLYVHGVRVCTYIPDFSFIEIDPPSKIGNHRVIGGEHQVLVDVKSIPTRTPLYRLKIKLLKAIYKGIDHRELL